MKMESSGIILAFLLTGACGIGEPNQSELRNYLVLQAGLPKECEAARISVDRGKMLAGDYEDKYLVTVLGDCAAKWRQALSTSPEWSCEVSNQTCGRYSEDGEYLEEFGYVNFNSDQSVTFKAIKI